MACPGLTLGSSDKYSWYLPDGFKETQRTVCSVCCDAYDIKGTFKKLGPSNCDSYLYRNKATNGVFNFSVWSEDKKVLYPSDISGCCVKLPTNGYFNLLISGYGLKSGQAFTWSLHTADDTLIEASPPDVYYLTTVLTGGFYYIKSNDTLTSPASILTEDSAEIVIKINIFNIKKKDPFTHPGDQGLVTVTSDGIFTDSTTEKILPGYLGELHDIHMFTQFERFTINPIKYTVKLSCDNNVNQEETLRNLKSQQQNKIRIDYKELTVEVAELTRKLKELKARESELMAQIHLQ
jgi:hypothetical protein